MSASLHTRQLNTCQLENAQLGEHERRAAQRLLEFERQSAADADAAAELRSRCDALEQRLAEADAVQSLAAAVDDAADDDGAGDVPLASVAVQTECTDVQLQSNGAAVHGCCPNDGDASAAAPSSRASTTGFELADFGDDIALLTDPAVQREEELIAFKEECVRLRAQLEQQLADAQRRLATSGGVGGGDSRSSCTSHGGAFKPAMLYAALAIAVIGYWILSPYW